MYPPTDRDLHPSRDNPSSSVVNPTTTTPLSSSASPSPSSCIQTPNLLSFPDEVIQRVLTYVNSPSLRGAPYYRPKPPTSLLPVSLVSTAMRSHASRLLVSDVSWVEGRTPCCLFRSSKPDDLLENYCSAWYRLAGTNLRHFTYASKDRARVNAIVALVAKIRPRLTRLDLSGMRKIILESETKQAVGAILRDGRDSIKELHVVVGSAVSAMVARAAMCEVNVLEMKYSGEGTKEAMLQLMQSMTGLKIVGISISVPLPRITEEEIGAVGGLVNVMRVSNLENQVRNTKMWSGWAPCVRGMPNLKELELKDVLIAGSLLRDIAAGLETLKLVNCSVRGFELCLNESVIGKVTHFEPRFVITEVEMRILKDLGKRLVVMDLKIGEECATVLGELLEKLTKLKKLTLYVNRIEAGSPAEEAVLDGVMKVSRGLKNLVVVKPSFSVVGLEHIITRLAGSLEYMVVGLNPGMGSSSLGIIGLLRGVVKQCKKLKILCFGMNLQRDTRAMELNAELLEAIEEVGRACEGLDTAWLGQNARDLIALQSPFQDG